MTLHGSFTTSNYDTYNNLTQGKEVKGRIPLPAKAGSPLRPVSMDLAAKREIINGLTVADMMVRPVLSVSADTPVEEVVALFVNRGLHPLPVVADGGRLVGIVGRADLLRLFLESAEGMTG